MIPFYNNDIEECPPREYYEEMYVTEHKHTFGPMNEDGNIKCVCGLEIDPVGSPLILGYGDE